jgi:hypothetical protein
MHFVKAGHLTRRYSWGTSNDMIFQDGTNFEYWLSKGTSIFSRLKTGQVSIDEAQPFDPLSSSFSHLSHTTKLFVIRAGLPPEPFCMSGSSSIFLRHGARHPLKAPLHSVDWATAKMFIKTSSAQFNREDFLPGFHPCTVYFSWLFMTIVVIN